MILKDIFYFKKTCKKSKAATALFMKEDLLAPIRRGQGEMGNGIESLCTDLGDVSDSKLNVIGHLTKRTIGLWNDWANKMKHAKSGAMVNQQ